mgnify:CR=1 FL=1
MCRAARQYENARQDAAAGVSQAEYLSAAEAQELSFSADELAVVQAQAKEVYQTMLNYLQNNKRLLLEQTFLATASLVEVLANCVIGFVVAIYCLLEKHRLVRNFKRVIFASARRSALPISCMFCRRRSRFSAALWADSW